MTERAAEKLIFTTVSIYLKIINQLKKLPGIEWQIQKYNYLYVTHRILSDLNIKKFDTPGCKINIEHLAILFGKSNQQTSEIIRNLTEWGILYQSVPAGKGTSARYLLTNEYNSDNQFMIYISSKDVSFVDKLIAYKKNKIKDTFIDKSLSIFSSSLSLNSNGYNYLNDKYQLFESNKPLLLLDGYTKLKSAFLITEKAILDLKNKKKTGGGYGIERRDIALFSILIKNFSCKRPLDKNGKLSRVYNNLTNLPREHRQYIHFCDKPLLMTDISNSQILLTVPMIEKYYKIHSGKGAAGIPDDVIKFKEWAESGQFYENFSKLIYYENAMAIEQRKELKIMIFRVLWFGKNTRFVNQNRVKRLFISNFPNVYKTMSALKKADYKQFSIELQRFEASIIIDKVAKRMLSKHPVLTLHDAIICAAPDVLEEAETRITKELAKFNLTPKFKREDAGKDNEASQQIAVIDTKVLTPVKSLRSKVLIPLKKKNYPIDEEYLAKSREYYASRTPERIIADYERYSGKKYPRKYLNWLYSNYAGKQ